MKEIGIYIHIPFCKRKCYYCDFISFQNKENCVEQYIKALKIELKQKISNLADNVYIDTVYIGGRNTFIYK